MSLAPKLGDSYETSKVTASSEQDQLRTELVDNRKVWLVSKLIDWLEVTKQEKMLDAKN